MEDNKIALSYIPAIVAKIFNEGVYKENYTLDRAKIALSGCVGANKLIVILIDFEAEIIKNLISVDKVTK